jgi:hypothetical protein
VGIEVHPVTTRADLSQFMRLPYVLHKHDQNWVPPLRRSMIQVFDARTNPFHEEAEVTHFLAVDSARRCVGRVAAIIHPHYVERYGPKAFFGFFESQEDDLIAHALLNAAESWAAERGMRSMIGPYSYTCTQDVGFLIDGFETPPALRQSHNPRYYPRLVESCGYKRSFVMSTYTATREAYGHRAADMIARGSQIIADHGFTIRPMNMQRYEQELEMLRQLYNRSFSALPESLPISQRVFHAQAKELKALVDPSLVRIVEAGGVPIAFSVLAPNINEILIGRTGHLTPGLILRWNSLMKNIRSLVIVMIGADLNAVGKGLGRCLVAEITRAAGSGRYDTVHTTRVHEKNAASRALLAYLRPAPTKQYAVFEKSLG